MTWTATVRRTRPRTGSRPPSPAPRARSTSTTGCHYQSATTGRTASARRTPPAAAPTRSARGHAVAGRQRLHGGHQRLRHPGQHAGPADDVQPLVQPRERGRTARWLVYSTTGPAGPWTNVGDAVSATAPYISAGGYDSTLQQQLGAPASGRTPTTGANGALKAVTVNLDALAGQTVWFGFRFSTDSTINYEGFYVDDIRINADVVRRPAPPTRLLRVRRPSLRLTGLPATVAAGTAGDVHRHRAGCGGSVTATGYTGTAPFTSTDPQAVLPAARDLHRGRGDAASASPSRRSGTQSVTATDTANPAISGTGSTTVTAGPPARLVFTSQPAATPWRVRHRPGGARWAWRISTATRSPRAPTASPSRLGDNPGGSTLAGTTHGGVPSTAWPPSATCPSTRWARATRWLPAPRASRAPPARRSTSPRRRRRSWPSRRSPPTRSRARPSPRRCR